jgi:hypothetical protein
MNKEEKAFIRGFAFACGSGIELHSDKFVIEEIYSHNFYSIKQLKEAGVDDLYIDDLKPIIKEILRKRKIK